MLCSSYASAAPGAMTEQFSLPEHFRNCYQHHWNWRVLASRENIRTRQIVDLPKRKIRMTVKHRKLPVLAGIALLALSVSFAGASTDKQSAHPGTKSSHHSVHHRKTRKAKTRGQKAIDGDRVLQIQQALAREHYLKGKPSGKWDASTQDAMRRYQAAQGWQTKNVPDSRALIRLGLGPDQEHLLNPESAMTTAPATTSSNAAASKTSSSQASSSQVSSPPTSGASRSGAAEATVPSAQVSTPSASMPADPAH